MISLTFVGVGAGATSTVCCGAEKLVLISIGSRSVNGSSSREGLLSKSTGSPKSNDSRLTGSISRVLTGSGAATGAGSRATTGAGSGAATGAGSGAATGAGSGAATGAGSGAATGAGASGSKVFKSNEIDSIGSGSLSRLITSPLRVSSGVSSCNTGSGATGLLASSGSSATASAFPSRTSFILLRFTS